MQSAAMIAAATIATVVRPALADIAQVPVLPVSTIPGSSGDPRRPFTEVPGLLEFSGRLLVAVHPGREDRARAALREFDADVCEDLRIWSITVPAGEDENSLAVRLWERADGAAGGLFRWIRPDWRVYLQAAAPVMPNDPGFAGQWHHPVIGSPRAWSASVGLREVTVAFVDTGVDLSHADLSPNLRPGYCAYLTVRLPQADSGFVDDSHGHGTAVAGAAAAVGNNLVDAVGVGWNLSIMPIRATNPAWPAGIATSMDIINGALWAADHGARIVNVSFSGVAEPYVEDLGAELAARHSMLIWPMDNYGIDYGTSFDHPNVLVVAGSSPADGRFAASSFGAAVDLAAPAQSIYTTTRGGGAWYHDGNSFAAPIVAGAAGLMLSVASELSGEGVQQLLEETADDLGAPGEDRYFGAGRINIGRAIWLAPLRQFVQGAAPERKIRRRYTADDLYEQFEPPTAQDLNGDGQVDARDAHLLRDLLRYDEVEETTFRPR